jgi:hypothetical protein
MLSRCQGFMAAHMMTFSVRAHLRSLQRIGQHAVKPLLQNGVL